jgi:hypothetical protein
MKTPKLKLIAFTLLLTLFCPLPTSAQSKAESAVIAKLRGTWKLVSMESRTASGEITYPYGKDAVGYIIYDATGHMSVHIMRAARPRANRQAPPEERGRAYEGYIAYFGTYELNEKDEVVIHHMEGNLTSALTGTDYIRYYEFEGDKLTLIPTERVEGKFKPKSPTGLRLTWQRVK